MSDEITLRIYENHHLGIPTNNAIPSPSLGPVYCYLIKSYERILISIPNRSKRSSFRETQRSMFWAISTNPLKRR